MILHTLGYPAFTLDFHVRIYSNMTQNIEPMDSLLMVTLGMFIIDRLVFEDGAILDDVTGGAGTWALLGARVHLQPPESKGVTMIVDAGSDFPNSVKEDIDSWQTGTLVRSTPERLTTRGLNTYGPGDYRGFSYMAPKLRIEVDDFEGPLLNSRAYHLICTPQRAESLAKRILERRAEHGLPKEPAPHFIWEPVPDECKPENWKACLSALKHIGVITPNHSESAAFLGRPEPTTLPEIAAIARLYVDAGIGPAGDGCIVIRSGGLGCVIASRDNGWLHLSAYHTDPLKVKDPTGAGNAFCGGLALGYPNVNLVEAARMGIVSASFAIEQIGVPVLGYKGTEEVWNGVSVRERMEEYRRRTRDARWISWDEDKPSQGLMN
ncbi:hypothetical protein YB2330_002518 [Saitoella coloradoensis]